MIRITNEQFGKIVTDSVENTITNVAKQLVDVRNTLIEEYNEDSNDKTKGEIDGLTFAIDLISMYNVDLATDLLIECFAEELL